MSTLLPFTPPPADWLVDKAHRRVTHNRYTYGDEHGDSYKDELIQEVEAIVYHYTADNFGPSLNTLLNPASNTSAHFIVDRTGSIWQLAALSDRTWHAGGKTSRLFGKPNTNGRTIGIEIVNWGLLTKHVDGWRSHRSIKLSDTDVVIGPDGRGWERYPAPQMESLAELVDRLVVEFPVLADRSRHVGHETVDPTRKTDPGAAFDWQVIEAVLSADRQRADIEAGTAVADDIDDMDDTHIDSRPAGGMPLAS